MKYWLYKSLFFSLAITFNIIIIKNAAAQDVGFPGNPLIVLFVFILIIAFVFLILFIQYKLSKNAGFLKLIFVWGIYPLIIAIWIGSQNYKSYTSSKFASREFKIQTSEITYILFSNPGFLKTSRSLVVSFLKFNQKNRIAWIDPRKVDNYEIYFLASLNDCNTKGANDALTMDLPYSRTLLQNGYFDECIMRKKANSFEYDLKIEKGEHIKRFMEPCCNTANFYISRKGKDKFIGRWEAVTRGKEKNPDAGEDWNYFDVLTSLTGIQYSAELRPYQFSDLNTELIRITNALNSNNKYYEKNTEYILQWLTYQVLGQQYYSQYILSDTEFQSLTKLISSIRSHYRGNRKLITRKLNIVDKERLKKWER